LEDNAAGPEPGVTPQAPDPELQKRLHRLEQEAAQLREQISAAQTPTEPAEPQLPPPTAEQIENAENLIRQARLARSRGLGAQATEFLNQAEAVAPNAPIVLEFIGDDYAERGHFKKAREVYKKALEYAPNNVAIDRKHAEMVFKTSNFGSLELYSDFEVMANAKRAMIFTYIFPGAGQLVTGQWIKGGVMLGIWLLTLLGIVLLPRGQQLQGASLIEIKGHALNLWVLPLLAIAFIDYIVAVADSTMAAKSAQVKKIAHPEPPDKLPFE